MSSEKRKASSDLPKRPKKKQQIASSATIEHVPSTDVLKPIIATTAGASFPSTIKFQSFSKKTQTRTSSGATPQSQILIQSSEHPTIDYTAVEGDESTSSHLKHYVGVFDPETNRLKLVEAKHLTVRGSLRQRPREEDDDEDTANVAANQATRSALTEAFGSKKSKKAVQAIAENRQLGQGLEGATIAEAIASRVKDEEEDEEEDPTIAATTTRSSKPLPQPNLRTDDIEDVYSLSSLVVPSSASRTLQLMPIGAWRASILSGKDVQGLRSRFVANRITYVGKRVKEHNDAKSMQQMQLLRYIELLVEVAQFAAKQDRRRKMKFVDEWPENTLTEGVSPVAVKSIAQHFFPDNTPNERAMTLLRTTIFALTLHILPPSGTTGGQCLVAEPTDVQLDLAMEAAEVRKLFHELGCRVAGATDKELMTWGYSKLAKKDKKREDGSKIPKPVFAVLKFPLDFPKPSTGKRARR